MVESANKGYLSIDGDAEWQVFRIIMQSLAPAVHVLNPESVRRFRLNPDERIHEHGHIWCWPRVHHI